MLDGGSQKIAMRFESHKSLPRPPQFFVITLETRSHAAGSSEGHRNGDHKAEEKQQKAPVDVGVSARC